MKRFTFLVPALATLAACGAGASTNVVEPSQEDYNDAAQAIASSAGKADTGDFAAMGDATVIAGGVVPSGFLVDANGQLRGSRFGIEYTYTLACEDAGGNAQPACNELTDRATVEFGWVGSFDSEHFDAALAREGEWSVRGLTGPVATFDGDGTLHVEASLRPILRPGVTERFELDADSSMTGVMIDRASHTVLGGSLALDLTARRTVSGRGDADLDRTFDLHADLTFAGDGTAELVLDGTHAYEIDMATGLAVKIR